MCGPMNMRFWLVLVMLAGHLMAQEAAPPTIHKQFDQAPRPLRTPPPEYPAELLSQRVSGAVLLRIIVDDRGAVRESEIIKSSDPAFVQPSLAAVRKWRFDPARKDGAAVWVSIQLPLSFSPE